MLKYNTFCYLLSSRDNGEPWSLDFFIILYRRKRLSIMYNLYIIIHYITYSISYYSKSKVNKKKILSYLSYCY